MISDNFTAIPSNSSVVEYLFAFDNSLGGIMIFSLLWAIVVVMTMAIYSWKRDFVDSAIFGLLIGGVWPGFLATLIRSVLYPSQSLLAFAQWSVFVIVLVLLVFYKKWSDG